MNKYPWLPLPDVLALEPFAASLKVSEVARGKDGFVRAYEKAQGKIADLPDFWLKKREDFIRRHRAQMISGGESGWVKGQPSRRTLALAMWAYAANPDRLRRWVASKAKQNPRPIPLNTEKVDLEVKEIIDRTIIELGRRQEDEVLGTFRPPYYLWSGFAKHVVPFVTADKRQVSELLIRVVPLAGGEKARAWLSGGYGFTASRLPAIVLNINGSFTNAQLSSRLTSINEVEELRSLLRHEFTHAMDVIASDSSGSSSVPSVADMTDEQIRSYFNDPKEVRAYAQNVSDEAINRMRLGPVVQKSSREMLAVILKQTPGTLGRVYPFLSEKNKRYILKVMERSVRDAGFSIEGIGSLPNPSSAEDYNIRDRTQKYEEARKEKELAYVIDVYSLCTEDCEGGHHVPIFETCERCGAQIHKKVIEVYHPELGEIKVGSECIKDVMGWKWSNSHDQAWELQILIEEYLNGIGMSAGIFRKGSEKRLFNESFGDDTQYDGQRPQGERFRDLSNITWKFRYSAKSLATPNGLPDRIVRAGQDMGLPWTVLCKNKFFLAARGEDEHWMSPRWLTFAEDDRESGTRGGPASSKQEAREAAERDVREFWFKKGYSDPHEIQAVVYRFRLDEEPKCTTASALIDPNYSERWNTFLKAPRHPGQVPSTEARANPRPIPIEEDRVKLLELVKSLWSQADSTIRREGRIFPDGWVIGQGKIVVNDVKGKPHQINVLLATKPSRGWWDGVTGEFSRSLGRIVMYVPIDLDLDVKSYLIGLNERHWGEIMLLGTLLHEVTHAKDVYSQDVSSKQREFRKKNDWAAYLNQPIEIRARMQELSDMAVKSIPEIRRVYARPNRPAIAATQWVLEHIALWQDIEPLLSDKNRQKLFLGVERALRDAGLETEGRGSIPNPSIE